VRSPGCCRVLCPNVSRPLSVYDRSLQPTQCTICTEESPRLLRCVSLNMPVRFHGWLREAGWTSFHTVLGICRCGQHILGMELCKGRTNGTILGWQPSLSRICRSIEMASTFFASRECQFGFPDQTFIGDFITTPSPALKKSAVLPRYGRRFMEIQVLES
jgi:hypothetical protein